MFLLGTPSLPMFLGDLPLLRSQGTYEPLLFRGRATTQWTHLFFPFADATSETPAVAGPSTSKEALTAAEQPAALTVVQGQEGGAALCIM